MDQAFKRMARPGVPVELAHAKGSVQEAARELGRFAGAIDSIAPANRPDHQMATVGRCRKATKALANLKLRPPS